MLDIAPTLAMYEQTTEAFARAYWHWFFLIRPAHLPERMIGADPKLFLRSKMGEGAAGLTPFAPEAWAQYERCFTPGAIHASCEDYRAGATIDYAIDDADYGKRKIACPMLALWGEREGSRPRNLTDTWKEWADDVRGLPIRSGHFLPEEAPGPTLAALLEFFGS